MKESEVNKMALSPHLVKLVAIKWYEALGMGCDNLEVIINASTLADADLMTLLDVSKKNVYPQLTQDATGKFTFAIMADGQFPQMINTNKTPGFIDKYDVDTAAVVPGVHGVLGQPENAMYHGNAVAQPNPPM